MNDDFPPLMDRAWTGVVIQEKLYEELKKIPQDEPEEKKE